MCVRVRPEPCAKTAQERPDVHSIGGNKKAT
jgi:hypothetical protein